MISAWTDGIFNIHIHCIHAGFHSTWRPVSFQSYPIFFSSDRDSKLFNQDIIIKSKTLPSGCLHSLIRLRLLPRGRHFFLSPMIKRTRSDNDVIDTLISDWSKTKTGKTSKRCGGLGKHRIV